MFSKLAAYVAAALICAATTILPGSADAATMTYTSGNLVTAGGPPINSTFDISAALPSGYYVTNASITANFQDKLNEHYFYQTQSAGANNYNWVYLDPYEAARLDVGDQTFMASPEYRYVRYFSRTEGGSNYFDVVDGYWGDFSISALLAQSAVDTLNATGQLGVYLTAAAGDFRFLDITLSYDVAQTMAPVPLPAALPLFATAIGSLSFAGWVRKRKSARARRRA
jgi:hypothetical protein